ncbi:hypothetical protein P3W85_28365 [Cupriavidus basilensis]|uniref:Uncharacterized protein n=1 Tax=Cupriavidus basilensis TaxID=68895 RepID=A0ABT6AW29_9BURK|nr:hypothetical protein [Cupriavidus basilensis]MDF3836835.1 hypothetical protein [Cupriavidus basilensis]
MSFAQAQVTLWDRVEVRGAEITLGQMADLSALPEALRLAAAPVIVARMGNRAETLRVPKAEIAEHVRLAVPAMRDRIVESGTPEVSVSRIGGREDRASMAVHSPADVTRQCVELVHALSAGEAVGVADVAPVACQADPAPGALYYDALHRVARARRDMLAGERVVSPWIATLAAYKRGETKEVAVKAGPVVVSRHATALQDVPRGVPLFMATAEGHALVARPERGVQ